MMAKDLLTDNFAEPLNGAATARIDIQAGDGNLTIDRLRGDEQMLASGTLQYFENQDLPTRTLVASNGQASLTLRGSESRKPWFHLPWSACNGAKDWQIHLNPSVLSDIIANSGGGNLKMDLTGMAVTSVLADTGGGNVDVVLPANAANLNVSARTGGGNVTVEIGSSLTGNNIIHAASGAGAVVVRLPSELAARIHATTGLGKVTVDPQFGSIDKEIYQSSDFDSSTNKVEITVKSGAGDVSVIAK